MSNYVFVKGYRDHSKWRESFFELVKSTFGIDFTSWWEKGFWTDKYIPYSFVDGDKIIANVSVNLIGLVIDGEKKRGIQIGTVMTHPDYRNKGLSRKLMSRVLEDYEGLYDVMYLFANQTVLDFYPKFGFSEANETLYLMNEISAGREVSELKKLDGKLDDDLHFISDFAKKRNPISMKLGTYGTEELLLFYCLNAFPEDIYYLEEEEVIAFFRLTDEKELHIYDLIFKREINFRQVVEKIIPQNTERVIFHFTVDDADIPLQTVIYEDDGALFVRLENGTAMPSLFKHPLTSQA